MSKSNSWIRLSSLRPGCSPEAMVGCTEFAAERDFLYPERVLRLGSTIIWIPSAKAHVSVASYVDAFRNGDEAAIEKLRGLGVPPGIDFGYGPGEDLSCMYEVKKDAKPRKKKADSVKIMRARHAARFEDGEAFGKGEVVKILFRKKFVEDRGGAKRFQNAYERPSTEELADFLEREKANAAAR